MLKFSAPIVTAYVIVGSMIFGCTENHEPVKNPFIGDWELLFHTDSISIPARLRITADSVFFKNGIEKIQIAKNSLLVDTLRLEMPHYDTEIKLFPTNTGLGGEWRNNHKDNYFIPVSAVISSQTNTTPTIGARTQYACDFSETSGAIVGLINFESTPIEGTFLTETGDYRYLEGVKEGNDFYLSCFDGAHLFYFSGRLSGDSIKDGLFLSGKHYTEKWTAVKSTNAELSDPDSLTLWTDKAISPSFMAMSISADTAVINEQTFIGKVTALSLVGTWCPNCTDLERFILQTSRLSLNKGFQFIPICFEQGKDSNLIRQRVKKHFAPYGSSINPLIGGASNKTDAHALLPQLSGVTAFPTTLIIDKKGKVRHIHTGFYGPGTGEYHTRYGNRLINQINELLAE